MRAFFYEKQKVALSRGKILLSYMGLLCVMETRTYWVGPLGEGCHVSAMYVEYRKKILRICARGIVHGGKHHRPEMFCAQAKGQKESVRGVKGGHGNGLPQTLYKESKITVYLTRRMPKVTHKF